VFGAAAFRKRPMAGEIMYNLYVAEKVRGPSTLLQNEKPDIVRFG
jgi:hypothetical protein